MTAEMVTKFKCDRCEHIEEVKVEQGFLGPRKPKPPASWGSDLQGKKMFCPRCNKAYDDGYERWFNSFMKEKQ
jgi:hypothetical protein